MRQTNGTRRSCAGVGATCSRILEGRGAISRSVGDILALCPTIIVQEGKFNILFERIEKSLDETDSWVGKERLRSV